MGYRRTGSPVLKDQSICVKGSFTSDDPEEIRSYIAEWSDGLGNTRLSLGKDMRPGTEMHWEFRYPDPDGITPNVGKIFIKDYETCEIVAVYPIEINEQEEGLLFDGAVYRCDADMFPVGDENHVFDKTEPFCISGTATLPETESAVSLEFVWEDGLGTITKVAYEDAIPDQPIEVYFYYQNPGAVTANQGTVKVVEPQTGTLLQSLPVVFYDSSEELALAADDLMIQSNTYQCDDQLYATGKPTSTFAPDQYICVNGSVVSADPTKPLNLLFDWEDGLGYSTLLVGKNYFQNQGYDWYYYYYEPQSVEDNDGVLIVKDYDTCEVLEMFPVNIRNEGKGKSLDAGTDL